MIMATHNDTLQQMEQVVKTYGFRKVEQDSRPAIECVMPARFRNKDEQVRVIIQPDVRGAQTPRCWCPGIGELESAINSELFDLKYRKEWKSSTSTLTELVEAIREGLYKNDLYNQQPNPSWHFTASYPGVRDNFPWPVHTHSLSTMCQGGLHQQWPVDVVSAPQESTSSMAVSASTVSSATVSGTARPHVMPSRSKSEFLQSAGNWIGNSGLSGRSTSMPAVECHHPVTGPLLNTRRTPTSPVRLNGHHPSLPGYHPPVENGVSSEAAQVPHKSLASSFPSNTETEQTNGLANGGSERFSPQLGIAELRRRIRRLESDLEESNEKLEDKTRQLKKAQDEIHNLNDELDSERGRFNLENARGKQRQQELQQQLNDANLSRQQMLHHHETELENRLRLQREECQRLSQENERLREQWARGISMATIPGSGTDADKERKLHALQSQLEQDRMRAREFERQLQISETEKKDLAQQLHEQKAVIESLTVELKQMEREYGGLPDSHELSLTSHDSEPPLLEQTVSLNTGDKYPVAGNMASVPALSDSNRMRMYQVHAWRATQDRQEVYILFTTKVADYDIVRMIDHGCEGAVYLVRCKRPRLPEPSKLYALKVMFNIFQLGSMTQVRKQFQTEYDILAVLPPHRNIVRLFAFFFDRMGTHFPNLPAEVRERARSMSLFLVMEYHPHTLADVCLEARLHQQLTFELLVNWSYQLAEAALFLHHHNVVHRDMKLNNVLMSRDGILKVCDFGFAVQTENVELTVRHYPNMPRGGNPSHLAPEVLLATSGQSSSDTISYAKQCVWELGVLIHEMVTAKSPFCDLDQMGYCTADLPDLPLDSLPTARAKDTSSGRRELQRLVKQMLEFEPKLRPTVVQAHAALTSLNTRFAVPSAGHAIVSTQPKSLPAHLLT